MKLRDYQQDIFEKLASGRSNDIVQLDTGAGKTPIEAALAEWSPHTLLVAHRNVLIQQISEKLAAFGLEHDTISTEHTRRRCMHAHKDHGRSFIRRGHKSRLVASMQSIVSAVKHGRLDVDASLEWLIVIDEAHHVIPSNMWGHLREIFPHSRIIGFTATPARMDGESLHVSKGGLFEMLVQASSLGVESTRTLIDSGYLSGFACYAARTTYSAEAFMTERELDQKLEGDMTRAGTGDHADDGRRGVFSERNKGLDWSSKKLELMGDPVAEYKRVAIGSRAILMAPAITNAEEFAESFRAAGIPSACINSTQTPAEISRILDAFRVGRIRVLTNVDMVGEGFDLPACETLIIATRTASFPRYRQWCGRVLRPDDSKQHATIVDLTGMCAEHGQPDEPVEWDLLNPPCGPKERKQTPCDECGLFFLFKLEHCPSCGWENAWIDRSAQFSPGTYYFNIEMIDQSLRAFVIRERRASRDLERMKNVLRKPPSGFGGDLIGRTVDSIAAWFPEKLQQAGVSIAEINKFLISQDARSIQFYIRNFAQVDLRENSSGKALKVYKKWRKQQSSTATQ